MTNLSVAIRSVKANTFLRQLLDSVHTNTLRPDEIVIVIPDDITAGKNWGELFQHLTIPVRLVTATRGMVSQRAEGIRASRGDFVLLLDDDLILPDRFIESMMTAAGRTHAKCVVPFRPDSYPKTRATRFLLSAFSIAVPYMGKGGNKHLVSGGFTYPLEPLGFGEVADTETGIGAAILIDRKWSLEHGTTGDMRLQLRDNPYSLRDDSALVYSHHIAGGLSVIVNAGQFTHLGGTTRQDSRRRMWAYDALIRNNFVFWKYYIYDLQPTCILRMFASLAIGWHLVGVTFLAIASTFRHRSTSPLYGLLKGYFRLVRDPI